MRISSDRSPMYGSLGKSVSLNDLIQLLAMTRRTATVALKSGRERGALFFHEGQIVHASAGAVEGEDGLLRLLEWSDAEFSVQEGVESLPRVSIAASTEALLLDALRRLDERRSAGRGPQPPGRPLRRPSPAPPRTRARFPWTVAAGGLVATAAMGFLAAGSGLSGAPWEELPERRSPSIARGRDTRIPAIPAAPAGTLEALPPEDEALAPSREAAGAEVAPVAPEEPVGSAPPPPGDLTVVVEPWGVITIDGERVGETPLPKIALEPGEHELTVENPNVVGAIRAEVAIASGESVVRRFRFSDVGYLLVLARPWAEVEIDDRRVGETPLPRIPVPTGSHVVRFRHPELGVREHVVDVDSGGTARVQVDWRKP